MPDVSAIPQLALFEAATGTQAPDKVTGSARLKAQFRTQLEADLESDAGIVCSRAGKIDRRHYAQVLGVSKGWVSAGLRDVLEEYELRLQQAGLFRNPHEQKLRALLQADSLSDAGIKVSRGKKVDRQHYAKRLGLNAQYLSAICQAVFEEYEAGFSFAFKAERRLTEMRAWLDERYASGELEVFDGRISRKAFAAHFGFRGGTFLTRYPLIRDLFEEFDARAAAEGYLPREIREAVARLEAALAADPELNKDRLTVSRPALARVTGIKVSHLWMEPYVGLIDAKDAALLEEAKASPIDPYFHGRNYPFSDLSPPWPIAFLERVGVRFKQIYSGRAADTTKSAYRALRDALAWICADAHPACLGVLADVTESGKIQQRHWEEALFAYRDYLVARLKTGAIHVTVDGTLASLRGALEALESAGLVPPLSAPLPGVKYSRRKAGHLKSVAEATKGGTPTSGRDPSRYVEFAREQLRAAADRFRVEVTPEESGDFLKVLHEEASRQNLPDDPSAAVLFVLDRRLEALRSHARGIIETWKTHREEGKRLLSLSTINAADFHATYVGGDLNDYERRRFVRRFFQMSGAKPTAAEWQISAANLLGYAVEQHGGLLPGLGNKTALAEVGQFFQKRYLELGGLTQLDAYLSPPRDACGAALVLYQCESGANISVGRTLDVDCITASDIEGYKRITGHKARAQGRPIFVDLPESSDAISAMEWLAEESDYLRANAPVEDADRLFLMRVNERCQLMTPHWYTSWFKKFAAEATGLDGVRLVPSMIRPSVLLKAALENDGRLQLGLAIGQHTAPVAQGYQRKWPTRLLYDQHIRRFQEAFEALVARNITAAAEKLGVPAAEFARRMDRMKATGLGTFCADPTGRPGNEGRGCTSLDCWNECPQMLVVAEVEAIAALQLWQTSLREVRPEWERDRPERWDAVWLPWLCLADVVEEKMVRGPNIVVWNAAKKRAAELSVAPGFIPPKPW